MHALLRFLSILCVPALLPSTGSFAAELQAGRDYNLIDPPLATPKGKIEVIEFFSYGCSHCKEFHPLIDAWEAKLPKDVVLRRVPVSFNRPAWAKLSRLYFALDASGEVARLNGAVFKALHEDRINFNSDEAIVNWAVKNGLDGKKFGDMLVSFGVQSMVPRADKEAVAAHIQGVPSLVVDGKYLLSNEAAGNYIELLKRVDTLVAKARAAGRAK